MLGAGEGCDGANSRWGDIVGLTVVSALDPITSDDFAAHAIGVVDSFKVKRAKEVMWSSWGKVNIGGP